MVDGGILEGAWWVLGWLACRGNLDNVRYGLAMFLKRYTSQGVALRVIELQKRSKLGVVALQPQAVF